MLGALGHYVSLNHLRSSVLEGEGTHKVEEAKRQQASAYRAFFGKCSNKFCRKAKRDHYGPDHRCLDPEEAAAAVREAEGGEIAVQQ